MLEGAETIFDLVDKDWTFQFWKDTEGKFNAVVYTYKNGTREQVVGTGNTSIMAYENLKATLEAERK